MQLRKMAWLVSTLVWWTPAAAQDLDRAAPESVGMSSPGLPAAPAALQEPITTPLTLLPWLKLRLKVSVVADYCFALGPTFTTSGRC